MTASARECITCYGRDGTTASRSIDTEGGSAALILTRKQWAFARPSVSFQQVGPGFQVRILLTLAVTLAAVTLFKPKVEYKLALREKPQERTLAY